MTAVALPVAPAARQENKWVVALAIGFGSLMAAIDSSIVNVAMPQIRGTLGASVQEITWVATSYIIATVLVMPLTGFLGAIFGQKRLYVAALVLFLAGSMLCGVARTLPTLVLFRAIQGLGGGVLQPTQQAILRQTFPPKEQGMAMAMFAMVIMIGPAVGPSLGGWLTDNYSWPWIFYINLPVGVVGVMMTLRFVHEPPDVTAANVARAASMKRSFDHAGIVLLCMWVATMQYVLEEGPRDDWFESTAIAILSAISVVSFLALIIRELHAENPVINIRLLKDRTFTAATVIGGVLFAMLMGSMFLLPVFMQELLGFDATQAGVALMPRTFAMMALMPIIGRIYNKVPPAIVIGAGGVLFSIGSLMLSRVTLESSSHDIILPLVVTGFGFAALFIPLTTVALANTRREDLADAAGLSSFVRQIGGSVGLTIFATLLDHYQKEAYAGAASHVTILRPEVTRELLHSSIGALTGRTMLQSAVLAFERVFALQAVAFIVILPLLFFLRPAKVVEQAPHVELSME